MSNAPSAPYVEEHCVSRPPGAVTTCVARSITGSTVDRMRMSRRLLGFFGSRMANLRKLPTTSSSWPERRPAAVDETVRAAPCRSAEKELVPDGGGRLEVLELIACAIASRRNVDGRVRQRCPLMARPDATECNEKRQRAPHHGTSSTS
uniref:Uncharacterized protein n=1 Tax=Anopheles atroparvus TaxID=41427 RepID=A0A182J8E5_ANOAO